MELLVNIVINILLSIIDLYMINLYLENYLEIRKKPKLNIYMMIGLVLITVFNTNIIKNNYMNYILLIISLYLIIQQWHYSRKQLLIYLSTILLVEGAILVFLIPTLEWIFDTNLIIKTSHPLTSYQIFLKFIGRYIELSLLQFLLNRNYKIGMKMRYFKTISLFIFVYLILTATLNNKQLFYFPTVGKTFVFIIVICIIMLVVFDRYQTQHDKIEKEMTTNNQRLLSEKEYIETKIAANEDIIHMRHDLKNSYYILAGYLQDNNYEKIKEHVEEKVGKLNELTSLIHTGNTSIDCIINEKTKLMKMQNIQYFESVSNILIGDIEVSDLALLIGLALDNAIEANANVSGHKEIILQARNNPTYLVLLFTNTIVAGSKPVFSKTSKKEHQTSHGIGVKEIKKFAKKYDGDVKYTVEENHVILRIALKTSNG